MKRRLAVALIVPVFAVIFTGAVVAGYLMGQTSFRAAAPAPAVVLPPGAMSGPAGSSGVAPPATPEPQATTSSAGDQSGTPSAGPDTPAQQPPAPTLPSAAAAPQIAPPSPPDVRPAVPGPFANPDIGPSASPAIPEPPSRFHVQAGSFNDRDSAVSLIGQLRNRGYAVTLVDGPPYRVWVGGYLDRSTAERLAANLLAAGFGAALTPR